MPSKKTPAFYNGRSLDTKKIFLFNCWNVLIWDIFTDTKIAGKHLCSFISHDLYNL